MVSTAIKSLKDRTGSSLPAIKKFLDANYKLPDNYHKALSACRSPFPTPARACLHARSRRESTQQRTTPLPALSCNAPPARPPAPTLTLPIPTRRNRQAAAEPRHLRKAHQEQGLVQARRVAQEVARREEAEGEGGGEEARKEARDGEEAGEEAGSEEAQGGEEAQGSEEGLEVSVSKVRRGRWERERNAFGFRQRVGGCIVTGSADTQAFAHEMHQRAAEVSVQPHTPA